MTKIPSGILALVLIAVLPSAWAHHVLGRPAYSLNEDSNTPPAMTVETQIGNYFISAMVFPAFPRPGEPGRVHFYATHLDTGEPLDGSVEFRVRNGGFLAGLVTDAEEESLGAQVLDDGVYRQGFIFSEPGNYVINVAFQAGGEPYSIDVPLRVGAPSALGPLGIAALIIVLALLSVSLIQRKRVMRAKIGLAREERKAHGAAD
ncbi:MAG: hypothetical protein DSZ32_03675 [Gammaproteobacteria bacterium]|nr:MAG: hypothetical protein DSZ33_05295 [Gammaproteobacteria bacterium]RTZ60409.1 MAG: hypothetical protein DSZ32_03675 [Gammaproteobacteria bacterium]